MASNEAEDAILAAAGRWREAPAADAAAEIQNLMQAYALFTDRGRAAELAALFTADAEWDGTALGYGRASGPDAIAATVLGHFDPARPMIHVPGPALLVSSSADAVTAVSWCLATRATGGVPGSLIYFHYHDDLRREAAGWRFAKRLLTLRFRGG